MQSVDRLNRRVKLRELRIFLAVVEAGSMARAAQTLAVSQPVVSKAIADLERTFGVVLFDRSHNGVEPTAYGRALMSRGAAIFDELHHAAKDIQNLSDPGAGDVRIGAYESLVSGLISSAIDELHRVHPRLVFQVRSSISGTNWTEDLRQRRVDFSIGRLELPPKDPDLSAEVLFYERLFVVAGKGARLPANRPLLLKHLLDAAWVLPRLDTHAGIIVRQAFLATGVDPPSEVVATNSIALICSLVASGRFLAILPGSTLRFSEMGRWVRVVPVLRDVPPGPVAVITVTGRKLSPAVALVIAHLRRRTSDMDSYDPLGVAVAPDSTATM